MYNHNIEVEIRSEDGDVLDHYITNIENDLKVMSDRECWDIISTMAIYEYPGNPWVGVKLISVEETA